MNYLRNTKRCINYSWRSLMNNCKLLGKENSYSLKQRVYWIVPNLLKKEGLTMDDFHYMMQKHANALTPNEIKKLTRIRKAIPKPDENRK